MENPLRSNLVQSNFWGNRDAWLLRCRHRTAPHTVKTRIGSETVSPSYLVDSAAGRAAIFLRPLSEYVCLPLRDDVDLLDFVQSTVDEAVAALGAAGGGIVSSRRYRVEAEKPVVANVKVLAAGSLQLASEPLDEEGQLGVRDLDTGEQPGLTVRTLLAAPK